MTSKTLLLRVAGFAIASALACPVWAQQSSSGAQQGSAGGQQGDAAKPQAGTQTGGEHVAQGMTAKKEEEKLPPGMTGGDVNDPRYKLKAGVYDAGEVASGMEHVAFVKKGDAFQAKEDEASVAKTLGQFGINEDIQKKIPPPMKHVIAQLAFANSDLAFEGNTLFQGNFYGLQFFDISDPAKPTVITSLICPGGQGDVSVYGYLLFMSVEMPNGRLDCGTEGFPPPPTPAPGHEHDPAAHMPAASKDRFRGVRIFDISDLRNPVQVGQVQTCRGSHTHTLVVDPKDKDNVYIYVSGTSFVRQNEELDGCSGGAPDKNPNTALFRIDVIKVPLANPKEAKIVSSPRVFMDPQTHAINGLNNGGSHDAIAAESADAKKKPVPTDQCHDITVYPGIGLAAGACEGNGILLDISDPANPKRVDAVNDVNYSYWHSATFNNEGTKVVFTDEWGGGMEPRCKPTDPTVWGADAIFNINHDKLAFDNYYKMPAAQGPTENCVAHNGSLVPVPGRDIEVQAWYQGGVSVMDFTDPKHPFEIAYFDRGPYDANQLVLGGDWSAYWYNGNIYGSEIARGLDVFRLTPTKFLSQNEIDAAKQVQMKEFNVQAQEKLTWPPTLLTAKAYVDQLERSNAVPAEKLASVKQAIASAEGSSLSAKDKAKLKKMAPGMEKMAASAKTPADAKRFSELAKILSAPQA